MRPTSTEMHPEMQAFFDKHKTTCECKTREAHDLLLPIARVVHAIRKHVLELQHDLHEAELAAHDARLDPKYAYLHTRIAALDSRVTAWSQAGRDVATTLAELENGFTQATIDVNAMLAAVMQPPTPLEAPIDG